MITRNRQRLAFLLTLLVALLPWFANAKKDEPRIALTKFDNALREIFYFDDSNVILAQERDTSNVWRSADAGETWDKVDIGGLEGIWALQSHRFDNTRAYVLGFGRTHYMTTDRGETWTRFETEASPSLFHETLAFHGRDPKKVVFNAQKCVGFECDEASYYTDDDFKTVKSLKGATRGCKWATSTPLFGIGIEPAVDDRIFCVARGLYSPWQKDNRLLVSDDHFATEFEPELDGGRTVQGIIDMAPVTKYLLAAAKAEGTDELALYVSDDGSEWHRAVFGKHRIDEDSYTVLESTNYSIQIDVMNTNRNNPMGVLFTSNSNGTYFTRNIEHTNRNMIGNVDFEKIQGIQGIVLVNTVKNWEDVEKSGSVEKQVVSQISFDDGRTFHDLTAGKKRLHLHSVTDLSNAGRVFSSPAPGIVMGIGNTGDRLRSYEEGDLYISDDAGLTWRLGLEGAHKYEFGNQGGVVMAINDEESTDHIRYSINHGKDWTKVDLGDTIRAKLLVTVPDSTSLKFFLMGTHGMGARQEWYVYMIDFEGLHEKRCAAADFERWPARVDEDGNPSCIMGHKQFYRRRKADADCFVEGEFVDPVPESEPCTCTKADFECDYNFVRSEDGSQCLPSGPVEAPAGACKSPKDTFRGSSGWRLISGDDCTRRGGEELDREIDRPCEDSVKLPPSGEVAVEKTFFNALTFSEWYYLERTDNSELADETLVMRTSEQEIYVTRDHGKTWTRTLEGEPITAIAPHAFIHDIVYFLTGGRKVFYSIDRAERIRKFEAPAAPSDLRLPTLHFHPDHSDWLLWLGSKDCPGADCHTNVHYTQHRDEDWHPLLRYSRKCEFIQKSDRINTDSMIYCEQYQDEDPSKPLQLVYSEDWFASSKVQFSDILDFATMSEFVIVAAKTEDQKSLKVDASVDGHTFAAAEFPPNFHVAHQQAYTVLDSSTHAVFLHVTVNSLADREYGTIIKSNSNGTSYVLSLSAVNRDAEGYVDFEKMQGLEGVAMVNVVANLDETKDGQKKKLKSMITHNDGAEWDLIPPPKRNPEGGNFGCVGKENVATEKCALHIHSYTERYDKAATFSSPTAIGLMMAVGNVGEYLNRKDDPSTHTFITRDGGITWLAVKKGSYIWEYGDQGSLIVLVEESKPTRDVFYSLDEGSTWIAYRFTDIQMQIDAITTVPSDNSLNFLLWGKELGEGAKSGIATVNLDFTGLKERQRKCDLNEEASNDDYYFWEPKHPLQADNCLFGHVAQYHRKRPEAECFNGRKINHFHGYKQNCTCTRQDFEW